MYGNHIINVWVYRHFLSVQILFENCITHKACCIQVRILLYKFRFCVRLFGVGGAVDIELEYFERSLAKQDIPVSPPLLLVKICDGILLPWDRFLPVHMPTIPLLLCSLTWYC